MNLTLDGEKNKTPVLITGFARPLNLKFILDVCLKYFDANQIYISLDGTNLKSAKSQQNSLEAQKIARNYEELGCHLRISDTNLGCYRGNVIGINWFFSFVENGIILEDDILPSEQFFKYAITCLQLFKESKNVGSIAGSNIVPQKVLNYHSELNPIRFSNFTSSWGWATWADRWSKFQEVESTKTIKKTVKQKSLPLLSSIYWNQVFKNTFSEEIDSWAFRWLYTNWKWNWVTIVPNQNLVSNIGFSSDATHTNDKNPPWWLQPIGNLDAVQLMPNGISLNMRADKWMEKYHYRVLRNLLRRIFLRLRLGFFVDIFDKLRKNNV